MAETYTALRSHAWFSGNGKGSFIHRSWMKNQGLDPSMFDGRPVVGICNTWSELTPCNAHLRELAEHVRRGIIAAGGLPLEFPVMSLGESNMRPTAMMFRNLASMEVEETIRANPLDGVVLLVGCDKTTPALVMGALSCDLPTIVVSGGPMIAGHYCGKRLGSGTDVWRLSEEVRAGQLSEADFIAAEAAMSRSAGSCNTMGTASTMACMVEALGLSLSGNAAIPAVDSRRKVFAYQSGIRAVELVRSNWAPSRFLTKASFENAIRVNAAIGGSTNAVIHLLAIAGRCEIPLTLDDWDRVGKHVPTIVNLMPAGRYLMEDLFEAGGLRAVIRTMIDAKLFDADCLSVTGHTMAENTKDAKIWNSDVIQSVSEPLTRHGGIAVLRGNLAPDGAVLKPSAATPRLMQSRGRAVVFENIDDYHARIDSPDLDVDESSVMVLKNCGPRGYPGMPEVGSMGLPKKLLEKGITDLVRLSDARMSGTAYGTVVLHIAPESAIGGPLAAVRSGDVIELDVQGGRLHLDVPDSVISERLALRVVEPQDKKGYEGLFLKSVTQADKGCDFDFLVGKRGAAVASDYV